MHNDDYDFAITSHDGNFQLVFNGIDQDPAFQLYEGHTFSDGKCKFRTLLKLDVKAFREMFRLFFDGAKSLDSMYPPENDEFEETGAGQIKPFEDREDIGAKVKPAKMAKEPERAKKAKAVGR